MKKTQKELLEIVAQAIFDKKGFNILALDVREISSFTDYLVIAEGNVERHVKAIGESVQEKLKECGESPVHVDGEESNNWLVIDFLDIMVHLFMPDIREKYQLEHLWKDGQIVDLNINPSSSEM